MAWRRIGDKPLSEPMLTWFTDTYMRHWGRWVNINRKTICACFRTKPLASLYVRASGYDELSKHHHHLFCIFFYNALCFVQISYFAPDTGIRINGHEPVKLSVWSESWRVLSRWELWTWIVFDGLDILWQSIPQIQIFESQSFLLYQRPSLPA